LHEGPAAGAFAIEAKLASEPLEAAADVVAAAAELGAADDRRKSELSLTDKRLRVDCKPRFALGAKDVPRVQLPPLGDLVEEARKHGEPRAAGGGLPSAQRPAGSGLT